jgi:hypothetical protein
MSNVFPLFLLFRTAQLIEWFKQDAEKLLYGVGMALTNIRKSLILRSRVTGFEAFPALKNPFSATC